MDSKNTHMSAAQFQETTKTYPCVICDYYILYKFAWKSGLFIGLQEGDILANKHRFVSQ